ncbi:MAG: hypothetical protein K6E41_02600 [Solobacterium sp.]|jgi:hypothetical protein|nr:hypothetical protein [Solobacterium sp.]
MYRLNEEKVFYDIAEGQAVVINFITGVYYGFSSLGSEVLDRLVKGCSAASVLKMLQSCEGCPEDMEKRMAEYIKGLLDAEILVEAQGEGAADSGALPETALEDGFDLILDEHAEVKDILMADPVHDVDVDTGWPIMKEEE